MQQLNAPQNQQGEPIIHGDLPLLGDVITVVHVSSVTGFQLACGKLKNANSGPAKDPKHNSDTISCILKTKFNTNFDSHSSFSTRDHET